MPKFIASILCFLIFPSLFGQNLDMYKISGSVISKNTLNPIPNGIISISHINGFHCDSIGNFTIVGLHSGVHKLSFIAFGYPKKDTIVTINDCDIQDFIWPIYCECYKLNKELALKDIKSRHVKLFLQSGFSGAVYSSDKEVERKYGVSLHDFGCLAGDHIDCIIEYNKTVFVYLDNKFGTNWRKEIRSDIIGLNTQ